MTPRRHLRALSQALLAGGLGVAAAALVSCGTSSGKGLIPLADAGPLQADFEAVSQAAASGNGSCAATEAALAKTEADFHALPASVDSGLRARLDEGIRALRTSALAQCAQATATTATTAKTATTNTATTTATTPTTPTSTTSTSETPPPANAPTGTAGGTPPAETQPPAGQGNDEGGGASGGVGPSQEAGP